MAHDTAMPQILAQVGTRNGLAFQFRKDPMGTLDVPELEEVLISVHAGVPARMACRRDGRRFIGTAVHGDIDVIPAHTASRWEMHDENDTAVLLALRPSLLQAVATEFELEPARMEIRNRFQARDAELEKLSWAIKREAEMGCHSGRLYLDGLALAVASRLVSTHSSAAGPRLHKESGLVGHQLKRVLSYIEEHLAEDLSLERIASVASVGQSHLKTLFRNSVGKPVHQYVVQRRVERAQMLLLQGHLSMAEVAQRSGFAHQSHMARHMRRALGVQPRVMRRLLAESRVPR
jgi:AraC family transcriptional regulator